MRNLLLMRHPLPRRVLVTAHLMLQLGLLAAATGWTLQHLTPIGPDNSLLVQWPVLAQGIGGFLLAFVLIRLLFELMMSPHHLVSARGSLPTLDAAALVTRSISRRPAVHDNDDSWVGKPRSVTWPREGEEVPTEPSPATAAPRTTAPAKPQEPSLGNDTELPTTVDEQPTSRTEPSL
ncbi:MULTISPECIES: hypothetical protein [Cobetia]|uniref:Uncharacterized protein n=1 Tax=Cobetia crustatorum TaxID=553385 RepID=A0A558HS88_9GAMM|nr:MULTISPECIES: hypothetical protein [Cobetia]TVU72005.1 hypothetical protein FQP86_05645 [Cobetia crustatorum]